MRMLLAGEWINGNRVCEVRNPYNEELIDTVPKANSAQVEKAYDFAAQYDHGLKAWDRFEVLNRFCTLLSERADDFIRTISLESGKTLKDAEIEVNRSLQTFLFSAEEAKRINGETLAVDAAAGLDKHIAIVIREPIGTVLAITPFNYPLNLVAHKVGPALAANNPVIVKPSSLTPLSALKMAELLLEAGLPPHMIQVLTGDSAEIGDPLVTDTRVAKVSFTGSAEVGQALASKAGVTQLCLELGGNDPLIVLEDADLEAAVPICLDGAFGNNGERCTSIKRVIIEHRIADNFVESLVCRTKSLRVGNQLDPNTDIGPLITEAAATKVQTSVDNALKGRAQLLCGGERKGALYWPTILDHVPADDPLVVEETFGPVAPVIRVDGFEEAIHVANSTPYGLQSGIMTNNLQRAVEAAKRIEAGAVMINKAPGFRAEHLPFGGVKSSGFGREGVKYAVDSMTRQKTIVI